MSDNEKPRLSRPRVFLEAQERQRLKDEWESITEDERQVRLQAMWDHQQDERYLRAREKLIALIDDGRFQQTVIEAVRWCSSRRTMRDLQRRAKKDDRDGRHARWLLVLLARTQAEVQERADQQVVLGPPIKVRTRFATDGEKVQGRFEPDGGPRVNVRGTYAQPEPRPGQDDEEE